MKASQTTNLKVILKGGLGNQLFIWSATNVLIANTNRIPQFLIDELKSPSLLDLWKTGQHLIEIKKTSQLEIVRQRILSRFLKRFPELKKLYTLNNGKYILEEVGYDHKILSQLKVKFVDGYFQSYRYPDFFPLEYFHKSFDLELHSETGKKALKFLEENNPICLHVRAGDYRNEENQYFGILSQEYYVSAIDALRTVSDENILIFTDDLAFVREKFNWPEQIRDRIFFVDNFNLSTLDEFKLLSYCSRLIIANSTFSWWGAYLAGPSARIVAPNEWFKIGRDPVDLIPPRWQTVQSAWI